MWKVAGEAPAAARAIARGENEPSASRWIGGGRLRAAVLAAAAIGVLAAVPGRTVKPARRLGPPPPAREAAVAASSSASATPAEAAALLRLPPGFPAPVVPADNPLTAAKVDLGRHLFYDRRLSGDGAFACASCHRPELAFTDGRARAVGATGELHPRSVPSLANPAYAASLGWADPSLTRLEDQALVPMLNRKPVELGIGGREAEVLARLAADAGYRERFAVAFPGEAEPFTLANVARAVASFERTLISGDSPYDRLLYRDDRGALSPAAWRGMRLFFSARLACSQCHAGFNFSGPVVYAGGPPTAPEFHNTGLYDLGGGAYPADNPGLFEHTGRASDMGRFRAPTLRNVALTAPYMHDGSVATLAEAIDHYAAGGRTIAAGPLAGIGSASPWKSARLADFTLSAEERADLMEFLASLTDAAFINDPRFADPWRPPGGPPPAAASR